MITHSREASSGSRIAWRKLFLLYLATESPVTSVFLFGTHLRRNCEGWYSDKKSLRYVYGTEIRNHGTDYIPETLGSGCITSLISLLMYIKNTRRESPCTSVFPFGTRSAGIVNDGIGIKKGKLKTRVQGTGNKKWQEYILGGKPFENEIDNVLDHTVDV
ncbi:hypothetical protein CDAR_180521 [Caerostris darwini]|uniref:Uncharacterized protein n=1 Tax=Caerostris darwini TaxID=1538125 RepID=A0AAV4STG3_9ARAC|nr:hypothetical protein CDAR_180521 [Caerostris darwini]